MSNYRNIMRTTPRYFDTVVHQDGKPVEASACYLLLDSGPRLDHVAHRDTTTEVEACDEYAADNDAYVDRIEGEINTYITARVSLAIERLNLAKLNNAELTRTAELHEWNHGNFVSVIIARAARYVIKFHETVAAGASDEEREAGNQLLREEIAADLVETGLEILEERAAARGDV